MKTSVLAIALSVSLVIGVRATTLIPATLGDLSRDAQVIVRGQVVAVEATWTDDHRAIETLVTLSSDAYLKGQLGSLIQFRIPGGRLGRFESIMVGAPRFALGQRAILFLGARGPSIPYVLGLSQGVYRLREDGGKVVVTPPPVVATGRPAPIVRGDRSRHPIPLAEFEGQVRALSRTAR
jgi:hypothetical protein